MLLEDQIMLGRKVLNLIAIILELKCRDLSWELVKFLEISSYLNGLFVEQGYNRKEQIFS